jgi:hypothetical protein
VDTIRCKHEVDAATLFVSAMLLFARREALAGLTAVPSVMLGTRSWLSIEGSRGACHFGQGPWV